MSKSAIFKNNIDISGNLDISGNMTLLGSLNVGDSATFKIHSQDFPSLPTDLCGQILVVNNSGDGLEWIKSDSIGGNSSDSRFHENASIDDAASGNQTGTGTGEFYNSLLTNLGINK